MYSEGSVNVFPVSGTSSGDHRGIFVPRGRGPDSPKDPHVLPFLSAPIHHFGKTVSFVQDGHGALFVLCIREIHSTLSPAWF